jgi:hypothetical protein
MDLVTENKNMEYLTFNGIYISKDLMIMFIIIYLIIKIFFKNEITPKEDKDIRDLHVKYDELQNIILLIRDEITTKDDFVENLQVKYDELALSIRDEFFKNTEIKFEKIYDEILKNTEVKYDQLTLSIRDEMSTKDEFVKNLQVKYDELKNTSLIVSELNITKRFILNSHDYKSEEDDFMTDFTGDYFTTRATDREREKYNTISKKYLEINNIRSQQPSSSQDRRFFYHTTPLVLDVCNGQAHLYGRFPLEILVLLPEECGINITYPKIIKEIENSQFRQGRNILLILHNNTIGLFYKKIEDFSQPMKKNIKSSIEIPSNYFWHTQGQSELNIDVTFLI